MRVWDVRPFAPKERCVKIFQGNVHNFEKVSSTQQSSSVHLSQGHTEKSAEVQYLHISNHAICLKLIQYYVNFISI